MTTGKEARAPARRTFAATAIREVRRKGLGSIPGVALEWALSNPDAAMPIVSAALDYAGKAYGALQAQRELKTNAPAIRAAQVPTTPPPPPAPAAAPEPTDEAPKESPAS